MSFTQFLTQSFEEHSIAWLLLSAFIGGLIGAVVKFVFEFFLAAKFERRWDDQKVINELSFPLLRAADSLQRRIELMLQTIDNHWFDDQDDDYFRISTLYQFGVFLGWVKILEESTYLEFSTSNKTKKFYKHFRMVLQSITGLHYFEKLNTASYDDKSKASLPRLIIRAIGELMTTPYEKSDSTDKAKEKKVSSVRTEKILQFTDFVHLVDESEDYKKWFGYLSTFLSNVEKSQKDLRWDRLIVMAVALKLFVLFLDPRGLQTTGRRSNFFVLIQNPEVKDELLIHVKTLDMEQFIDQYLSSNQV